MNGKNSLFVSIISLALLTALTVGCNKTTPAPTVPLQGTQPLDNTVTKISYVGTNTCKQCHTGVYDTASHTSHFDAFKPLANYPLDKPLTPITVFDAANTEKPTSTTLDLSKAKVYGVMVNDYVIAEVPTDAGFKNKLYRVAALKKTDDKWTLQAAKQADVDKDGKPDWTAEAFTCGGCHAPGIDKASPDYGISCESCHGPGGTHASATDKKGTMNAETAKKACLTCHKSDPIKDAQGNFTTDNHHGTRDYFASKHSQSSQLNQCQTCHTPHKANANGDMLQADKPADICVKCHAGKNLDPDKLMWKNPTDPYGHITKDHSFGAIKYEDLQDDPATKPIEIKNPTIIELIKSKLPELAK